MLDHYLTIHSDGKHEIIIESPALSATLSELQQKLKHKPLFKKSKKSIVMLPIIVLLIL